MLKFQTLSNLLGILIHVGFCTEFIPGHFLSILVDLFRSGFSLSKTESMTA